jgi:molybdopterin synthase sulfur carrier subunit
MHIQLRLFASLREALCVSAEDLDLPDSVRSVDDVLAILRQRGDDWMEALAEDSAFRIAVDQCLGDRASLVRHGTELAIFPPVTGG